MQAAPLISPAGVFSGGIGNKFFIGKKRVTLNTLELSQETLNTLIQKQNERFLYHGKKKIALGFQFGNNEQFICHHTARLRNISDNPLGSKIYLEDFPEGCLARRPRILRICSM